jgi:sugar phosphate isomerase/epimerase
VPYPRRELLKLGLSALPLGHLLSRPGAALAAPLGTAPDSRIAGVQIGIIAPYAFRGTAESAEEILAAVVKLGIDAVELQSPPAEVFAGAPPAPPRRGGDPGRRREPTPEQRAARRAWTEALSRWRLAAPVERFAALRRMYGEAGVRIYAFKLPLTEAMPDAEYDYCFEAAKALGANHVTMELNENTERVGRFAAKHEVRVGYHNHTQVDEHSWDAALAQSPWNGINLDIGHFTAAISRSPMPFIEKHHARITSVHFKDRRYGDAGGDNLPWGQGNTPLAEVLELMKRERYAFPATIELEYPVPEGSSVEAELRRCLDYCREALTR